MPAGANQSVVRGRFGPQCRLQAKRCLADAADGDRGRLSQARDLEACTRSNPICCWACLLIGRIRCGRRTSRISRWSEVSSISRQSWTGSCAAVLSWRLSITLGIEFCIAAVDEALARYGTPPAVWA